MSIDILGALAETATSPARTGRCKLQRWLDSIDPETPGLAELTATINTPRGDGEQPYSYRPLATTLTLIRRLGCTVGMTGLHQHRTQTCGCYR